MNLALPALVILIALLPGIVFVKGYLSGRFPRRLAQLSALSELALYVGFAIPIQAIALATIGHAPFCAEATFRLMVDKLGDEQIRTVMQASRDGWSRLLIEYLVILIVAFLAGVLLRRLVWTFRLDIHVPALRMKHRLYYVLQGRLKGVPRSVSPMVDVMVETPGREGCRLYRGIVHAMEFDKDGDLSELFLKNAQRGKGRGYAFEWSRMPSEQFLIRGKFIHSINLQYITFERPRGLIARLNSQVRVWFRAFVFEEP